jgi:TRAP-type C4-dicarboxylate transport system permease small subunit
MAAAGFLALAHTLKKGEHIRVTLLVTKLQGKAQRALELWALFAATALATISAFYSGKLAWQSYTFNDMSTSNDATPLWIPQLAMAAGTIILAIAFLDEFILELQGKRLRASSSESLHNE